MVFLLIVAAPDSPWLEQLHRIPAGVKVVASIDPKVLRERVGQADAILWSTGDKRDLSALLPYATNTRWIHCAWTGVDHIHTPELQAHPAILTNAKGAFRSPLADWVTAMMLYFAFDIPRVKEHQQQCKWQPFESRTLSGQTLGIIGYGSIGKEAAQRAKFFGMRIVATRRQPEKSKDDTLIDECFSTKEVAAVLTQSDYILIAAPLTSETRGMIGAKEFEVMKPTAVLINVGRGPIVDEEAMIEALRSGRIRGAALDVYTVEPLPVDCPLWAMDNVVVSPHTADIVEGFMDAPLDCFFDNLALFVEGKPLLTVVDKSLGY